MSTKDVRDQITFLSRNSHLLGDTLPNEWRATYFSAGDDGEQWSLQIGDRIVYNAEHGAVLVCKPGPWRSALGILMATAEKIVSQKIRESFYAKVAAMAENLGKDISTYLVHGKEDP